MTRHGLLIVWIVALTLGVVLGFALGYLMFGAQ